MEMIILLVVSYSAVFPEQSGERMHFVSRHGEQHVDVAPAPSAANAKQQLVVDTGNCIACGEAELRGASGPHPLVNC